MRHTKIDPVTFEIVRHKLYRVTEESAIALENVSGTPATAEGHDMMTAVFDVNGDLLTVGVGFLHHLTSASRSVKTIIDRFVAREPWVYEDDVFMLNDSYSGALHCPDNYMISPVHWKGEIAGWVANFVHVTDVGGIDPGGFCPSARNTYQEGFMTKGLKLVERGKIRSDVFETILNQVRDPGMVGLDLKSQIAANNVAKQRMLKIYEDYGFETVNTVGKIMMEESEGLMRQRLLEIPNGTWRQRAYYDHPEMTLRIELAVKKDGDRLVYDFTGTDKEVPYAFNCCRIATWGAIFASIFPLLVWDITWNEGITRPVKLIAPEGTLVNCNRPMPVSISTTGIVNIVNGLSLMAISKMLGATDKYKNRPCAVWHGTHTVIMLGGLNKNGEYVVHHGTETFGGSGGGRAFADGVDLGGEVPNLVSRMANIESHELDFPFLYLFRRVVTDSGGPGKYRGGVAHEFAIIPYGGISNSFEDVLLPGKGVLCPLSSGIFGGYPGGTVQYTQYIDANTSILPNRTNFIKSKKEEHKRWGVIEIGKNDIAYNRLDGGGGYGDPLTRDPELVRRDVFNNIVSDDMARKTYGVVLKGKNLRVDLESTRMLRLDIRKTRIKDENMGLEMTEQASIPRTKQRLSEYLQVLTTDSGSFIQCTWCGKKICHSNEDWKNNVVTRQSPPSIIGPNAIDSGLFYIVESFCPRCATCLETQMIYKDDKPTSDEVHDWPNRA
jgi:N-methylhydantoinase B